MTPLVQLDDVWRVYPVGDEGVPALAGVGMHIHAGEHVAIMGHSGSGKSTLLNLLGCLDRPTAGRYCLGGADVSGMDDAQLSDIRNRRIGFVFQSFNLIPWLNLLENIEVPMFYLGLPRQQRRRRSRELADRMGLGDRVLHRPTELSGGQKQRVAIARALANNPLILLADEPTGNLDTATAGEILAVFDDLNRRGHTLIVVTHETDVAAHARRVIRLRDGRVESDRVKPAGEVVA
ncbi:MAG: ABC transporter ATP-binding protein [Planctomycetota bacterium]|nr:ABC transporter ATP-binding protein [Planctomycetota bacterium]